MLHEITWKDYWTFIAITSVIYWLIIISYFFRYEIAMLTKRKKNSNGEGALPTSDESNNEVLTMQQPLNFPINDLQDANYFDEDDEQELLEINVTPDAHALAGDIKEQIIIAQEKEWVKEELMFALQQIIKAYPQLKETSFKKEINNLIASECENHCSIHLSAEELNMLWVG